MGLRPRLGSVHLLLFRCNSGGGHLRVNLLRFYNQLLPTPTVPALLAHTTAPAGFFATVYVCRRPQRPLIFDRRHGVLYLSGGERGFNLLSEMHTPTCHVITTAAALLHRVLRLLVANLRSARLNRRHTQHARGMLLRHGAIGRCHV